MVLWYPIGDRGCGVGLKGSGADSHSYAAAVGSYQLMVQALHNINRGTSEFNLIISCIKNLLLYHNNFKTNSIAHKLLKVADFWCRFNIIN